MNVTGTVSVLRPDSSGRPLESLEAPANLVVAAAGSPAKTGPAAHAIANFLVFVPFAA